MVTKEHPKQRCPRQDGGEQALDGAIAPALAHTLEALTY
jgi:hypothetical protein